MNRQRLLMFWSRVARPGHGAGTPTEQLIGEDAGYLAFFRNNPGVRLPEGYGLIRATRQ